MIFGTETGQGIAAALSIEAAGGWASLDPAGSPEDVPQDQVEKVLAELRVFRDLEDMPPDPRLLRLLVDAAAWLHGESTRTGGWDVLGINPAMGRKLLNGSRLIDWPVFFTALMFGTGRARLEDRVD